MKAALNLVRASRWRLLALALGGTIVCALLCMVVTAYFIAPFGWPVMRVSLLLSGGLPIVLGTPIFGFLTIKLKQLAESNERLVSLNRIDPLTGVLNRATFTQEAERLVTGDMRACGALLIIDADHFKQINDCHGHRAGDEALVMIAASLVDAIEGRDALVGRLGGEEFGILLPGLRSELAALVSEHVRLAVEVAPRPASLAERVVTVSIGVAPYSTPADFARVFNRADEALYTSKRNGRNRVTLAGQTLLQDGNTVRAADRAAS